MYATGTDRDKEKKESTNMEKTYQKKEKGLEKGKKGGHGLFVQTESKLILMQHQRIRQTARP